MLIKEKEISEVKTYMRYKKNITLGSSNNSNSVLSLFGLSSTSVSALSYESNVGIGFSFNPTLTISFSSSDLVIDNLVPGSSSDSNVINVNVSTNASHGYTLAVNTNSDSLVHSNNTNVFNSIATDASIESLTSDNTWGYSYKLSNDTTWSNYSGLSSSTTKTLANTDNQSPKPIDFKIGAKASTTQASGEYTNIINFIAVSKPIPKTIEDIAYMQTFGELVSTDLQSVKNSMIKNTTYTLKDARDEQEYTVAKLEDGKIWMTKNLNLAGETEITSELSDVPENYALPTENGFQEGNKLPASSQEGFSDNTQAYVYNSKNNTDNCASPGCYSYYSWHTATAGSGVIITTDPDAPYSICPKGWRLPNNSNSDFEDLVTIYGSGENFYHNAGPGTVANFLPAGNIGGLGGGSGLYYTSTSTNSTVSKIMRFWPTFVYSSTDFYKKSGLSIRCLAK